MCLANLLMNIHRIVSCIELLIEQIEVLSIVDEFDLMLIFLCERFKALCCLHLRQTCA